MEFTNSKRLYAEAFKHIVGGVNSPSRSYKAVGGGVPVIMERADGAYFYDVDGNKYIDYLAAYGPIITGFNHPHISEAIKKAADTGVLYGTPTIHEIKLAKMLKEAIPSLAKVRFTNSGTEAVMTTIRVARAYTGRDKIIKFAGCYHGHSDLVLVAAGSGPSTLGSPDSAGVPQSIAQEVITVPYNEVEPLKEALEKWGDQVAAVLVEPIVGNFGIGGPHNSVGLPKAKDTRINPVKSARSKNIDNSREFFNTFPFQDNFSRGHAPRLPIFHPEHKVFSTKGSTTKFIQFRRPQDFGFSFRLAKRLPGR